MLKKTDHGTSIGIALAMASILAGMLIEGTNPMILLSPAPLILVFGGTIAAAASSGFGKDFKNMKNVIPYAFNSPEMNPDDTITNLVRLAEVARREGLLALDRESLAIGDPFFRKGIEMTVDGIDPEEIKAVLESEVESLADRHRRGVTFFMDMGGYSPTLGILGTVIGLVRVLSSLSNPSTLGPAVAGAFVATLWGVLAANIFWLPIANKLKRVSEVELMNRQLMMDGVLAIQAGSSPRRIEAKLLTYVAPKERDSLASAKAA